MNVMRSVHKRALATRFYRQHLRLRKIKHARDSGDIKSPMQAGSIQLLAKPIFISGV
jgi:hypothetical protein